MTFKSETLFLLYHEEPCQHLRFENGVLVTREQVMGGMGSRITRRLQGDKMITEGNVVGKANKFKIIFSRD